MMIFVLGDNLKFFLQFSWSLWTKPFTTESTVVQAVGTLWTAIELGYEIFVRARLIEKKKSLLNVHIHQAQNYFQLRKYCCSFELSQGMSLWIFLVVVLCAAVWPPCIPCPLLPLHLESTLLGGERSLIHTSRFPEACVSERQISRIVRTIRDSRFPKIHILFVCTPPRIRVYPRHSLSRSTSGVYTSFFPGSHLRVSRTPRVAGLLEGCCPTDTQRRQQDSMR